MAKVSGPGRRSLLIGGAAAAGVAVAAARVVPAKTRAAPRRTVGDRALHLAGLQLLPAGRCLSRRAGQAARHRRAVVPCRLLGLHRLEGRLRHARHHRSPARLRARAEAALCLHAGNGGRRHRPRHRPRACRHRATCWPRRSAARPGAPRPNCRAARTARSPSSWRPSRSKAGPPTSRSRSTTVAIRRRSPAARTRAACWTTSTSCAACRC